MTPSEIAQALDGLSTQDVECLLAGRITNNALRVAVNRCCAAWPTFKRIDLGVLGTDANNLLAEELNEMLAAARERA